VATALARIAIPEELGEQHRRAEGEGDRGGDADRPRGQPAVDPGSVGYKRKALMQTISVLKGGD
jgi:hypothetical protein